MAWRLAYGAIGLLVGLLLFVALMGTPHEVEIEVEIEVPTIICPPMMDAADAIILHYPTGQGPEPTELDYEFAEVCGFTTIRGPVEVVPPPPEEGGA